MFFLSIRTLQRKMIRGSTILRVFIVILITSYCYIFFNLKKSNKTPVGVIHNKVHQKSIPKLVSDKLSEQLVIPRYYKELNGLSTKFSKSLGKGHPDWNDLIRIGDIYSTGVFPFLRPDDICAQQCYTVVAKCPCPESAAIGLSKLVNIKTNPISRVDRQGESIDPSYSNRLAKKANKYINNLPLSSFKKNKNRYNTDTIVLPVHKPKKKPVKQVGTNNTRQRVEVRIDKQNVHDHGVTSAIKTNIERLRKEFENTKHLTPEDVVNKAMQICRDVKKTSAKDKNITFSDDDLSDAHNVIVSLTQDQYSSTGLTQIQILGRILQKIDDIEKDNPEVAQGVKQTLCKRLATGVENGKVVCASGKISRALSVFEGVLEDSQKAVSMETITKELGFLASKTKKDYLKTVGPEGRKAYDTIASVPQYASKMKEIFMDVVNKQYIVGMGMNENILNPIATVYADSF